jgi:hypothetical protein
VFQIRIVEFRIGFHRERFDEQNKLKQKRPACLLVGDVVMAQKNRGNKFQ